MEIYLNAIDKLARGYEYEEVQTLVEDTAHGVKKKITKTVKHVPPNFQAARYMINRAKTINSHETTSTIHTFNLEEF